MALGHPRNSPYRLGGSAVTATARDRYLIGKLGSYDVSTRARIDSHLRALGVRLTQDITDRQRANARLDIDSLLDARGAR